MSQYYREHPDEPVRHDWLAGGRRTSGPLPTSVCPTCGYAMDSATDTEANLRQPSPGDLSVCLNCGEFLQFNDILVLGLLPSDFEPDAETKDVLNKARAIIMERGRLK